MAASETPAHAAVDDPVDAGASPGAPVDFTPIPSPSPSPSPSRRGLRVPRHIPILIAGVVATSLLKGLRMPNLWSVTHMTFNYSQGFIRRGLFGQVLSLIGPAILRYNFMALLAVILFALAVLSMGRLVRRTLAADGGDVGFPAMALVFAASPGVVFLAHEIGYLDYVGLIVVPLFITWAARTRFRWLPFYVVIVISVVLALIHESMVIMFAPTMWLALAAHIAREARTRASSRRVLAGMLAHGVLVVLLGLATSSLVGTLGTKTAVQVHALQASIGRVCAFPLRIDAFDALFRPVRDNLFTLMPWFWSMPANQRYLTAGLAVSLPGLIALSVYALRMIARLPLSRLWRLGLWMLFLLATFGPEMLNLVGWDAARWNAICFVASFSCVAALRLFFVAPGRAGAAPAGGDPLRYRIATPGMLVLAGAAIVVGLTADYPGFLFDGYVVQWFPFDRQLRGFIELIRGGFTFMPRG
jgi:hypothetical protein